MTPTRFEALDAWRGICAIIVALEHLSVDHVLRDNGFVRHGARFVDFFFVLSGFVIAHAYRDRLATGGPAARSFMIRRIGRLWPLHVSLLALLVLAEVAVLVVSSQGISIGRDAFTDRNTLEHLPFNVVLAHGWGMLDQLTWNTPSWSISTELFAYGLFAVICVFAARWISIGMGVVLVGSALVVALVAPFGMASTHDFGLVRCLYGFATGVLVRSLWESHRPRVGTIGELACIAVVVCAVIWLPRDELALLVTPTFAAAVWIFASEDGAVSRWLRGRAPQALGAWSYSIYMIHAPIVFGLLTAGVVARSAGYQLIERNAEGVLVFFGPPWLTTTIIAVYVLLVVGLSKVTYTWIELPGQRQFARWAGSSR